MKTLIRIPLTLSCAVVLLLSVSCSTTKQSAPVQTADTYDSTPITTGKSGTQQPTPLSDKQLSKVLNSADPVELGKSSLFLYNMLNTDVSQTDVTYWYYPKSDDVVIYFTGLQVKNYLLFSKVARSVVRQAVAQYEKDFTGHVLDRQKNMYETYGSFEGHYMWGLVGAGNETEPKTSVGYKFVKKSPYFMLTLWPAKGVYAVEAQRDDVASSEKKTYFFTRKQITEMISFMDEDRIASIVRKLSESVSQSDSY